MSDNDDQSGPKDAMIEDLADSKSIEEVLDWLAQDFIELSDTEVRIAWAQDKAIATAQLNRLLEAEYDKGWIAGKDDTMGGLDRLLEEARGDELGQYYERPEGQPEAEYYHARLKELKKDKQI